MPGTDVDGPDLMKNLVVSTTGSSRIVTQVLGGVARRTPSGKYRMKVANSRRHRAMKKTRTRWCIRLVIMVLPAFSILILQEALAESKPDEIVAMDLLTVKEPGSQAESRLRVIRLTTRSGKTGYGDYLDFGLPAENEEETLARLVNRYAEQNHKKNIFLTDPSMRAVGVGHTVMGQTAEQILHAQPVTGLSVNALFPREGFGPMWQGPGKSGLVIALQAALLDLAEEKGPCRVRLCPSITIDREVDGKRRLSTPDEMQQTVASLKKAGFTAVRLELAGALEDEMRARGECAPYRYPQEVLGRIDRLVLASKKAAGKEMDLVVAASMNLSTDGMTFLALHCKKNQVTLLENPMARRHLREQCAARKEFGQPLGFGGDYHVIEDFVQGIKNQAGTVLVPRCRSHRRGENACSDGGPGKASQAQGGPGGTRRPTFTAGCRTVALGTR